MATAEPISAGRGLIAGRLFALAPEVAAASLLDDFSRNVRHRHVAFEGLARQELVLLGRQIDVNVAQAK